MQSKEAEIKGNEVVQTKLDVAMMQSIEVLLVYWILTQIYSLCLVLWMKLALSLRKELLINFLSFQRLATIPIHHEVKHRNLISQRVAKIDPYIPILFHMRNLQILAIMLPQQRILSYLVLRLVPVHCIQRFLHNQTIVPKLAKSDCLFHLAIIQIKQACQVIIYND